MWLHVEAKSRESGLEEADTSRLETIIIFALEREQMLALLNRSLLRNEVFHFTFST